MEIVLTDQNFEKEVLRSKIPVLVDFWAPWCTPCRMIGPMITELAEEFKDRIKVGKLNVDKSSTMTQRYGVMSIPTLMFFKKGMVVGHFMGVQPKPVLVGKINQLLTLGDSSLKNGKL